MNEVLEAIYRTGVVADADGNTRPQSEAAITRVTGEALASFVRTQRPARTLEIGMAFGVSTLFIAQALHDLGAGHHTAIDPVQAKRFANIGLLNLERAGLNERVRLIPQRSDVALPDLIARGETFDFAFIDGRHHFDYIIVDFFFVDQLLPVGGVVAFDDLWMPAVRKAVSFVLRNRAYERMASPTPAPPLWRRIAVRGRRFVQEPFTRSPALQWTPHNIVFLQKIAADRRPWHFHRAF